MQNKRTSRLPRIFRTTSAVSWFKSWQEQDCRPKWVSPPLADWSFRIRTSMPWSSLCLKFHLPSEATLWRALLHSTGVETAKGILLEGLVRPADWSFRSGLSTCDMPTFGAFLGTPIGRPDMPRPKYSRLCDGLSYLTEPQQRRKGNPILSDLFIRVPIHIYDSMLAQ